MKNLNNRPIKKTKGKNASAKRYIPKKYRPVSKPQNIDERSGTGKDVAQHGMFSIYLFVEEHEALPSDVANIGSNALVNEPAQEQVAQDSTSTTSKSSSILL